MGLFKTKHICYHYTSGSHQKPISLLCYSEIKLSDWLSKSFKVWRLTLWRHKYQTCPIMLWGNNKYTIFFRQLHLPGGDLQVPAAPRLLPVPHLHPDLPHRHDVLDLVLDQTGSCPGKVRSSKTCCWPCTDRLFNLPNQIFCWLGHLKMSFYYPTSHNRARG